MPPSTPIFGSGAIIPVSSDALIPGATYPFGHAEIQATVTAEAGRTVKLPDVVVELPEGPSDGAWRGGAFVVDRGRGRKDDGGR
jgi:hypothetical protein